MTLKTVTLKDDTSYVINEVPNKEMNELGIVFGKAVSLYAEYITTDKTSIWRYSSFCTDNVNLFNKKDIVNEHPASKNETDIYNKLKNNIPLEADDRNFLRVNYKRKDK